MADGYIELTPESIQTVQGVSELNRMLRTLFQNTPGNTDSVKVFSGYGSPEGAVTAGIGSIYQRLDGGTGTTIYIKETGTGDSGWVAK